MLLQCSDRLAHVALIAHIFRCWNTYAYLSLGALPGAGGLLHHLLQDQRLPPHRVDPLRVLLGGGAHVEE